jgi:GNAT superfamily N-acetyltransferase
MRTDIVRSTVDEVGPLRALYRQEMVCQIVHDSFPARGLSDAYSIRVDGRLAGYGFVANRFSAGSVDEFFLLPQYRPHALRLFRELLAVSKATGIRAQTNDRLLTLLLYDCGTEIRSDTILFDDALTTHLRSPGGTLRQALEADRDRMFVHQSEPPGSWLIESNGQIVATGGALFHYNPPYGDIFMEVRDSHRRLGFGSYLVQELKRICYEMGKLPVARCNTGNVASRRTLEKAGLLPCARVLQGKVAPVSDSGTS